MGDVAALLVRPRPTDGESVGGYLMRVAAANGFGSVSQLRTGMEGLGREPFDMLLERLSLSPCDARNLFGCLPRRWSSRPPPLGLAAADFNHRRRRWCPVCLRHSPTLGGLWSLKLACTCLIHEVELRDTCRRCGAEQVWAGVEFLRCDCGADLAEETASSARGDLLELSAALAGVGRLRVGDRSGASPEAAEVHRLVRYVGLFSPASWPERPGQVAGLHDQLVARSVVAGAAWLLGAWPVNFEQLLGAMHQAAEHSQSLQRTFHPLYRVLYVDLGAPCFQFLRDAFEAYLHQHWWGLICRRNRRLTQRTIESHPRRCVASAAAAAGVEAAVVRRLVQSELIPTASVQHASGRLASSIHERDVRRLISIAADAVSLEAASARLSLPPGRVRELVEAGVIAPLVAGQQPGAARGWLFSRTELERLQVNSSTEGESLRRVLRYWRLTSCEQISLVRAVLAGQFVDPVAPQASTPLGAVHVGKKMLAAWLATFRSSAGCALSVDQAAKTLHVKQQVVYALIRAGSLSATAVGGVGLRVAAGDIERFRSAFVSLVELARGQSVAPRALRAEIGVEPVPGPGIDGNRQYFFRRSDVSGLRTSGT